MTIFEFFVTCVLFQLWVFSFANFFNWFANHTQFKHCTVFQRVFRKCFALLPDDLKQKIGHFYWIDLKIPNNLSLNVLVHLVMERIWVLQQMYFFDSNVVKQDGAASESCSSRERIVGIFSSQDIGVW